MSKIALTKGKFALVDDEDFEYLNQFKWYYAGNGAAVRTYWSKEEKKYYKIYMHRAVMKAPPGKVVDHINGDRIDNRRSNLRVCEHRENIRNQRVRSDSVSGLKGVYLHPKNKNWCARIGNKHIGVFSSAEEAASAYDKMAVIKYGEFARTNS